MPKTFVDFGIESIMLKSGWPVAVPTSSMFLIRV
jgi:hypothetical protein